MSSTDLFDQLPFPIGADAVLSAKPSEIEREVMSLFEQFRNPLLRYALSFGIPVHDAEEIIQDVFLSLPPITQISEKPSRLDLPGRAQSRAEAALCEPKIARQDGVRRDEGGKPV
jgi:hypothetical protein